MEGEKWPSQPQEASQADGARPNVKERPLRKPELEERLSAYFGPGLPEHLLPPSTWLRLQTRLAESRGGLRAPSWLVPAISGPWARQRRGSGKYQQTPDRVPIPVELAHTYASLLAQSNRRGSAPRVYCTWTKPAAIPRVTAHPLGCGHIRLVLPREHWMDLGNDVLAMLLATGLARASGISRGLYLLPRVIFTASLLLLLTALPFSEMDRRALWLSLAALLACLISGNLLIWQERSRVYRADLLAMQWLGRERACQGLSQLAAHPRSRPRLAGFVHPGPRALVEPAPRARLARLNSTSPTRPEKRLTLVG